MKIKRPKSKQPIPKHAKRVFKGIIFDTYQWKQRLYDGSFATFEKIKRKSTVMILPVTKDGKIILTEQEQPIEGKFIGAIGGIVDKDKNEDVLEAAKRELKEEAGLEAKEWVLWDSVQLVNKIDWQVYTFVAKKLTKVKSNNPDKGENIKLFYASFDEFIKIATKNNFRDLEISIKVFRIKENPKNLLEMKKLFNPS
ncbi:hypothetical protein COT75_01215 [Candidatus Beckwithbacteria bacterium CG10_big_fil_rev_8_21_14_0_10_34_10]|uniref:Nudix hydrolase domain-containing protein n=1 Tax=Candidatus Beckwithbacteria bacterium CG10_big_fil_rev_8_21_14_0_10_34_10 TaxID=1974495 RepID=A0A2H0WA13_9BACT|nr:MAG: hypothetical protein COT75_01215 [Candidatus Beckwithbacteria bacterium CG10_big_fil_rev_8_21_14_0_10_34_10]